MFRLSEQTVTGPLLSMSTCSLYVPGYMKIVLDEPSFRRDATAEESVLNWPDVVAVGLTTTEPEGGEVLDAARTSGKTTIVSRATKGTYIAKNFGAGGAMPPAKLRSYIQRHWLCRGA